MGVFISWSDENSPSHELAKALDEWIPSVVQHVDCYLSSKDTVAGTLWSEKMMKELSGNNIGIVCLYTGNLANQWIHFEAGAIAAKTGQARLCPLLIDLKKSSVPPPLGMFQVKTLDKEEMFSVMQMINDAGEDQGLPSEMLRNSFDVWWEKLEPRIQDIKSRKLSTVAPIERPDREILEEILESVRSLNQPFATRTAVGNAEEKLRSQRRLSTAMAKKAVKLKEKLIEEVGKTMDPAVVKALSAGVPDYYDDQSIFLRLPKNIPPQILDSVDEVATSLGINLSFVR
jgi:hypothetical protein